MTKPVADVCLILEGTYPYVRGGVSSWIHSLVNGLDDITFSLLVISADRKEPLERVYQLPKNVVGFTEVYIHESIDDQGRSAKKREKEAAWAALKNYHLADAGDRRAHVEGLLDSMGDPKRSALSVHDAFHSLTSWEFVLDRYQNQAGGTSFIDYFWTWRAVHAPVFQAMIAEIPPARVYHPISTGYAGLLGALAKHRTGRPLLLTEHGIYVRERTIDIGKADWIYEEPVRLRVVRPGGNPLKEMWTKFFVSLGQLTYDAADLIITLFNGNQKLQHELGADPNKTTIVPNGVKLDVFMPLLEKRTPRGSRPRRVGFVGRVVPIKDVKHLIKACAMIAEVMKDVEFWVVGPTEEDPAYFEECKELVEMLGLEKLKFTGSQDVKKIYPEIDILVLTSVSEGQPLSILEAAAAGVPTVSTDVGACRELIEGGLSDEDRAIGPAGAVTPMGDAKATAQAILKLFKNPDLLDRMSVAGVRRAERYYGEKEMLARYHEIYSKYVKAADKKDGTVRVWRASGSS
jgi:glycosyltransferase involved in cell wall biosynthesis